MIITINIQNAAEYQWISQYLDEIKSHPTIGVQVQEEEDEIWQNKVNAFFEFADKMAVKVDKINIPNREARNER